MKSLSTATQNSKQPQTSANDIFQMPNGQDNTPKEQTTDAALMRMATDLTLNILSKWPMYRGIDDSERTLAFAVKTFDTCADAIARNHKKHFASLR